MTDPGAILTPDQRLRVFVSSTLTELAAERAVVREAVTALRLHPVMFEAGARAHPPREVYRSYLAQSQIYIGVYDRSYGWVGPGMDISGLEDEFRLAAETMPRLIYVREPAPDRDPRLERLLDSIRQKGELSYRVFSSTEELRGLVQQDIAVLLSERFERTGGLAPRESEPADVHRLPVPRTALLDREADLDLLRALVTDERVRLVTLAGPGGVGKTRLAAAVAERVSAGYPDGVRYVDLSAATNPAAVGEAFARSLRLRTSGGVRSLDDTTSFLRAKRLLLVVDNFEQVAGSAPHLAALLRAAPGVTALVTSRAPLRLTAERVFTVQPLRTPPPSTRTASAAFAAGFSAVQLFVDRARAADRRFTLTDENAGPILEITRRLNGLPLAIELAAARVPLLPPSAIAARLDDQLSLLTRGPRDRPARQRTLRDTLAWSYDLLPPDAQRLFTRIGAFAGGFDLAAVEAVAGEDDTDVLVTLESLVDAALVEPDTVDEPVRFKVLDSVRDFARERLADEGDAVRERHAAHYLAVAANAEPHLNTGASAEWLERLDRDHGNFDAALDWLLERRRPADAVRIGWSIWQLWWRRGYLDEAVRYLRRILEQRDLLPPALRGRALVASAAMEFVSHQHDRARPAFEEARVLAREAGDNAVEARALGPLASYAAQAGDFEQARELLGKAYELAVRTDEHWLTSLFHSRLGMVSLRTGDPDAAALHLAEAQRISARVGDDLGLVVARYTAAVIAVARGDSVSAHESLRAGLRESAASGDVSSVGLFLVALADLESARGRWVRAVRLGAAAATFQTPSSVLWMTAYVPPWPTLGEDNATLRQRLGPDRYDQARRDGERLGLQGVVAETERGDDVHGGGSLRQAQGRLTPCVRAGPG
ncbi:hypothetical protein Ais01nite_21390 [Asanoa ishikariensis]|uniref:Predicted ATPase n=1 Tax=Asanoa ishikariensis TaxID=137265 RepID=A0A1H3U938_9ACTN|nr:DUF4062 domain-containing protein [Asanoa ishikariensis]GIF64104.1 hypothetical protein Ais01nite_21390 [Asanoa ishikariensis]SDZ58601.1 Predicted ATPase [Asanoa ishikariensis]